MDAKYIIEYSPFELMYNGIRHTTVEKYAKSWNITDREVRILKEKLFEEENNVYACWLANLPHCSYFNNRPLTKDEDTRNNRSHLYYDESAAEGYWYVGADALTTIARDLIYKVGNAEYCISSNIYPALEDYKTELYVILNDWSNAVSPDEGKRPDEADTPLILFGNGWRPTDVEDIFYQWPDTFEATEDFVSALKAEYVDWIENKIAEMESALSELDRHDLNYYRQYIAIADNCAKEIADDMLYNARMCERKYFYYFRNYEQALCTEDGPDMYNRVLRILCNTTGFNFQKTVEKKQASL